MRRFLTSLLFATATLLLVTLAASLAWSFWAAHGYAWPGARHMSWNGQAQGTQLQLLIQRGRIIWTARYWGSPTTAPRWVREPAASYIPFLVHTPGADRNYVLWQYDAFIDRSPISSYVDPAGRDIALQEQQVTVPGWVPLAMAGLVTASSGRMILRDRRQRRWSKQGRCARCGYDLRAHHPGQSCPECGTHIAPYPQT